MNPSDNETPIQRTVREHEELHRRMAEIQKQAEAASSREGPGARAFTPTKLMNDLEELQSLLAAHFAFEEETGLPEELAMKLPHVSEKAIALRKEHVQLLQELRGLSEQGRETSFSRPEEAARFGGRVMHLISGILQHEENENTMIQDAYLDDLGTAD